MSRPSIKSPYTDSKQATKGVPLSSRREVGLGCFPPLSIHSPDDKSASPSSLACSCPEPTRPASPRLASRSAGRPPLLSRWVQCRETGGCLCNIDSRRTTARNHEFTGRAAGGGQGDDGTPKTHKQAGFHLQFPVTRVAAAFVPWRGLGDWGLAVLVVAASATGAAELAASQSNQGRPRAAMEEVRGRPAGQPAVAFSSSSSSGLSEYGTWPTRRNRPPRVVVWLFLSLDPVARRPSCLDTTPSFSTVRKQTACPATPKPPGKCSLLFLDAIAQHAEESRVPV